MRWFIALIYCAANIALSANAGSVDFKLHEKGRQYRNTGEVTLTDPVNGQILGKYPFATGGYARGSAPFGTYILGRFRDLNDDNLGIGKRWMISNPDVPEQGMVYDAKLKDWRTEIELHRARRTSGTMGCISVLVSMETWLKFIDQINYIQAKSGLITFTLEGNPDASAETADWLPLERYYKHTTARKHVAHRHGRSRKHRRH